jgi:Na+-driven multidrug efflux pump
MLVLITKKKHPVHIEKLLHYRPNFQSIREFLRIGVPNGIENGMFHFGKLITQVLISSMGTAANAANAVAATLANYQYMPGTAFSSTMVTVVGRCVGAGEKEQAKRYTRILVSATYISLWIVILATFLFSKPIIAAYQLSADASEIAHSLIIYHASIAAFLWPIAFTLPTAFRSASDVRFPLIVSMFSMWTFRVALSYVFSLSTVFIPPLGISIPGFGLGPLGVWVAMTVDWVFRTVLFLIRYFNGKWLTVYRPAPEKDSGSSA